jgi:hypothetical protein
MFSKKTILGATFLLASVVAFSQDADSVMIKKITDDILLNGKAYDNLRILCKSVGQRLSGSAGMYKGEDWGVTTLNNAGAEKFTASNAWYHIGTGIKEDARFKSGKRSMDPSFNILALGNSAGTGKSGCWQKVIEVKKL